MLLFVGACLIAIAMVLDSVTLASGDYVVVLSATIALVLLGVGCLVRAWKPGGVWMRFACAAAGIAGFQVVMDAVARLTLSFG